MILYHLWLQLPIQTRHKIAAQFNIPKRGPTEVFDNQIKADGYNIKEIEERLNKLSLQMFLDVKETDELLLWTWMLDKIEGRTLSQPNIDTTVRNESEEKVARPKRGRKPKAK